MGLDKFLAQKIFLTVKNSSFLSTLAVWGATKAVWFLAFLVLIWLIIIKNFSFGSFLAVLIGVLSSWAIQLSFAFLIHRQRPFQQNHEKPLMKLIWQTPSFPSGHTSLACSLAAGVFYQDPVFGSLFFFVAAVVALSRIAVGVHYISDILGGAVIGITVATVVSKLIFFFV